MMLYDKDAVRKRLRNLRERKKWSGDTLSRKLEEHLHFVITFRSPDDDHLGRQIVSAIEKGKGITENVLLAYSEIFNVSLEYLLCVDENELPEHKSIKEVTPLTDEAIRFLNSIKDNKEKAKTINELLAHGEGVIDGITAFLNFNKESFGAFDVGKMDFDDTGRRLVVATKQKIDGENMDLMKAWSILNALQQFREEVKVGKSKK